VMATKPFGNIRGNMLIEQQLEHINGC